MLRVIIPFTLGVILTAFALEWINVSPNLISLLFLSIVMLFACLLGLHLKKSKPFWFGIVLGPSLFLCGAALTISISDHLFPGSLKEAPGESEVYILRICDQPQEKLNSIKVVGNVVTHTGSAHGKVLVYIDKSERTLNLEYGDALLINTELQRVVGAGNPNEFNFARYLRFNNILYRGYVRDDQWQFLSQGPPSIQRGFLRVRAILMDKLAEGGLTGDQFAVASALILGYRNDLDKELMQAYAGAGATHVLAVSGLHVGIVYVILNFLLRFLDRSRKGRVLKMLITVLLLFGYAGLTGLSASVSRAATMFSFVAIGRAIDRSTNIFNTLAASAFCLMLYEPLIVMQVGFQLSYAAVIGIVLFQPRLFGLLAFENRIVDWMWAITCVSISAQIATFPLGLLYFHQFPNLFLLSNLIVIPAAAGILYLGFSLFVLSWLKPLLLILGYVLDRFIAILNQLVSWIEEIPYSVISGIDISIAETFILYSIIVTLLVFISKKEFKALIVSLTLGIVFIAIQIFETHQQQHQSLIAFYNVRKETAIAMISGKNVTFLASKALYEDEQRMLFHIRHHWWNRGVTDVEFVELNDSVFNRTLKWKEKQFAIINIDKKQRGDMELTTDGLDFCVLHDVAWKHHDTLADLKSDQWVLSSSLGSRTSDNLLSKLSRRDQKVKNLTNSALILK